MGAGLPICLEASVLRHHRTAERRIRGDCPTDARKMLEIRRSPTEIRVRVEGGGSFPLPHPTDLKAAALEQAAGWGDSKAAALIQDCDFDYELVAGKDALVERIAVVVTTSSENAAVLRDRDHPIQPKFWGAIMGACADIGDSRIVERGSTP